MVFLRFEKEPPLLVETKELIKMGLKKTAAKVRRAMIKCLRKSHHGRWLQYRVWKRRQAIREGSEDWKLSFCVIVFADRGAASLKRTLKSLDNQHGIHVTTHVVARDVVAATRIAKLANRQFAGAVVHDSRGWTFEIKCVTRILQREPADLFVLTKAGDTFPEASLSAYADQFSKKPSIGLVYGDHDLAVGIYRLPFFKPALSVDLLRSYNYIGRSWAARRFLGKEFDRFLSKSLDVAIHGLLLRCVETGTVIQRIPRITLNIRRRDRITVDRAGEQMVQQHIQRCAEEAAVRIGPSRRGYRIRYSLRERGSLSVIIPSHNSSEYLRCCVESVIASPYSPKDILIVENGSTEDALFHLYENLCRNVVGLRVVEWAGSFNFSAINNFAASMTRSELLLFLNNDTEAINLDFIERMAEHALRPTVGAVGAKLYYNDDTLQHAGVVVGLGEVAGHIHRLEPRNSRGYFDDLLETRNYSAVTAACMMVPRRVFERVGGFDESLAVAFNDVDLCLRIRDLGYLVVWTPFAELYHYGHTSRGPDDTVEKRLRLSTEGEQFRMKWAEFLRTGDPYYNPNLSRRYTDCSLCVWDHL